MSELLQHVQLGMPASASQHAQLLMSASGSQHAQLVMSTMGAQKAKLSGPRDAFIGRFLIVYLIS